MSFYYRLGKSIGLKVKNLHISLSLGLLFRPFHFKSRHLSLIYTFWPIYSESTFIGRTCNKNLSLFFFNKSIVCVRKLAHCLFNWVILFSIIFLYPKFKRFCLNCFILQFRILQLFEKLLIKRTKIPIKKTEKYSHKWIIK